MLPLPIDPVLPDIVAAIAERRVAVIEAEPGAGKTTRVPARLIEGDPSARIVVLEPRRIAARLAAMRVAAERGEPVGQQVGYQMRFEQAVGPDTRLTFMTEGVLSRRIVKDPTLAGITAVVLDEVHERHLEGDLAWALVRELQRTRRPDLAIVAMSATMDAAKMADALGGAPRIQARGRVFDVEIAYAEKTQFAADLTRDPRGTSDAKELAARVTAAFRQIAEAEPSGHVLVFLPGAADIRAAMDLVRPIANRLQFSVYPLHGALPIEEQAAAVAPSERRKIVLATNVAESSITIDGVVAVIDSGLANKASFSPWSGLPVLRRAPVSKASAAQRAGRAGRTRAGRCVRLFTRGDFEGRPAFETPEILGADLSGALLTLAAAGVRDPANLQWIDAPPAAAWSAATAQLGWLDAIDREGALTKIGRRMLDFPLPPRLARVAVEAETLGVPEGGARIVAWLGERDRSGISGDRRGPSFERDGVSSDVLAAIDALGGPGWEARSSGASPSVDRAAKQIARIARRSREDELGRAEREQRLLQAILAGFPDRVGRLRRPANDTRRSAREIVFAAGGTAALDERSGIADTDLVVALDAEERREARGPRVTVRTASAIEAEWLMLRYTDRIEEKVEVSWNEAAERAERTERLMFGALALEETPANRSDAGGEAAALLAARAAAKGWRAFTDAASLDAFLQRVAFARQARPDASLPAIDEAEVTAILTSLCEGKRSFEELRKADLGSAVRSRLSPAELRALQELAPESVVLGGGRKARISYEPGRPPWLGSRLQDFFGMRQGPSVAGGKVPVVLHLLAPNQRAVQVTTDLAGFWEKHYPAIAKELRRKYPKHAWPEDPRSATPTR